MDALQRERMRSRPKRINPHVGATLGFGARCLRIPMPHVKYRSKSIAASFELSPSPVRNQLTPSRSRRQLRFLVSVPSSPLA